MSAPSDAYEIKPGYHARLPAAPPGPDDPAFWTAERIAAAERYQIDVYRLAARLAAAHGYRRVLDVGSGPPVKLRRFLASWDTCVLVDRAEVAPLAHAILPRAEFIAADLETIELRWPRAFDLVVCADVIEHLVDPNPCVAFLRHHLAPGGRLVLSTPERDLRWGRSCATSTHPAHVREWNAPELRRYLEREGLRVEEQRLLPPEALPAWERALSWPLRQVGHHPARPGPRPLRWFACQVAICTR